MNLFADENMARAIVIWLRDEGHDVLYASEVEPGALDSDWLSRAEAECRIVLTADKDFGDLIFRDRLTSHGVVLLRLGDIPLKDRPLRLASLDERRGPPQWEVRRHHTEQGSNPGPCHGAANMRLR